jgi:redox-sensitive bicupin YhaK (pirin superfamily)
MSAPRYQGILDAEVPAVDLGKGRGILRVIAGEHAGTRGPAKTFTPMHVWDLKIDNDQAVELAVPDGFNTALVVLQGSLRVGGKDVLESAQVAVFEPGGDSIRLEAGQGARALLLSGKPIKESIVGHGPFVMNTKQEIRQAIEDYQDGKMGRLS